MIGITVTDPIDGTAKLNLNEDAVIAITDTSSEPPSVISAVALLKLVRHSQTEPESTLSNTPLEIIP